MSYISTPTADPVTVFGEKTFVSRIHQNNTRVQSLIITSTGIEVVLRTPANYVYANGTSVPDRVWKEVYEVKLTDGPGAVLELVEKVDGKHEPAHQVGERITFP